VPDSSSALHPAPLTNSRLVGSGEINEQTSNQSVFAMIPAPGASALLGPGRLIATRRSF